MECVLNWKQCSWQEWNEILKQSFRPSLLQSYYYARAVSPHYGQKPRWAVIEIDGQVAGGFQIMEASLFKGIIHAVLLDRGPFWLPDFGTDEHVKAFAAAYSQQFPKRIGRKRRWIPDMSPDLDNALRQYGWSKHEKSSYETQWIDLRLDDETLLANMRKSWRQSLRKAQKSKMNVEWDFEGATLPLHLKRYALDKASKGYDGPDVRIMHALVKYATPTKDAMLGVAKLNGQAIAGVIILKHGSAATYQIGWSTQDGRDKCAHHMLLWEAALALQSQGITDFDLGGANDQSASAVKRFKQGMGGDAQILPGLYM